MNSKHKNIEFNFGTKNLNNFPFLGVKITRKKTICYFDFAQSYILFWCFKFFSNIENFHIEVEHLRSILKRKNYPVNITDQCIKRFLDKLYVPKQIVPTAP